MSENSVGLMVKLGVGEWNPLGEGWGLPEIKLLDDMELREVESVKSETLKYGAVKSKTQAVNQACLNRDDISSENRCTAYMRDTIDKLKILI